jgi:predicted secreted protein
MTDEAIEKFKARADGMKEWLGDEAPYVTHDQKHLEANTPERAYWHFGYMVALLDVIRLLERRHTT